MMRSAGAISLLLLVLAGCSDPETADYDAEFRADFVDRCVTADAEQGAEQVCGCWYDQVSAAVEFDDLPSLDDLFGEDFDLAATRLPGSDMDVPMQTLAACVRGLGAEPTIGTAVPPPTVPRQPPPPTTGTTVPA